MQLSYAQICRAGGRPSNQDSSACRQEGGAAVWVVADGLGGHRGGEVASRLAVDAVISHWQPAAPLSGQAVKALVLVAQEAILARQQEEPWLASMRTTLVLLLGNADRLIWGHVGDSRLYHIRETAILHQTLDHSVPQALVTAGEILPQQIRGHEDRNMLLRAVGNPEGVRPTVLPGTVDLAAGDALLLCTDGFWEHVTENEMVVDLAKSATPREWLEKMEIRLLSRCGPNHDNYTAVAVMTSVEPNMDAGGLA